MIEQHIQAMLHIQPMMTRQITGRLQHDHNIIKRTYQVRAILKKMEKNGMVEVIASNYKVQLLWRLPNDNSGKRSDEKSNS